jgi:hypothetical protein
VIDRHHVEHLVEARGLAELDAAAQEGVEQLALGVAVLARAAVAGDEARPVDRHDEAAAPGVLEGLLGDPFALEITEAQVLDAGELGLLREPRLRRRADRVHAEARHVVDGDAARRREREECARAAHVLGGQGGIGRAQWTVAAQW